ncbi:MAG: hypothetical protein ACLQVI_24820 [Polyangiaceae bacterium]
MQASPRLSPRAPGAALALATLAATVVAGKLARGHVAPARDGALLRARRRLVGWQVRLRALRSPAAPLATAAARAVGRCRATRYVHEPVVDVATGVYDVDCSAFVGALLAEVAPRALAPIPKAPGAPYPRAFEFYDYLHAPPVGSEWTAVPTLSDLRPGDVVCWSLPALTPGDTGHVLVIATPPAYDATLGVWSVCAYDASAIAHFDDSRELAGTFHSGIGIGTLQLEADPGGRPSAFRFGPGDSTRSVPIAMARLNTAA